MFFSRGSAVTMLFAEGLARLAVERACPTSVKAACPIFCPRGLPNILSAGPTQVFVHSSCHPVGLANFLSKGPAQLSVKAAYPKTMYSTETPPNEETHVEVMEP